jgi:hypothetical protein
MALQPPPQQSRARILTRALRASPLWSSFREELQRRGHDPDDVVLIDALDDDEDIEVGLLYTRDGSLIAWRRQLNEDAPAPARILAWDDVTQDFSPAWWSEAAATYREAVAHARAR